MRSKMFRASLVVGLAVTPLVLASTVAWAADSTVGSIFTPTYDCGSNNGYTFIQTAVANPSYTVPSAGVITSVRVAGSTTVSSRAFKLARPSGGGTFTIVASTDPTSVPANGTLSQSTRIPTQAGDVLGMYSDGGFCTTQTNLTTDHWQQVAGNAPVGTITMGDSTVFRFPVSATVEPDVDGDGFGDTTQDQCPTQAGTHGLCTFSFGATGAPSGKAKVGKTLAAPTLSNLPAGATEQYEWLRLTKVRIHHRTRKVYLPIRGAVGSHYTARRPDKRTSVRVRITVSAPSYATSTVISLPKRIH